MAMRPVSRTAARLREVRATENDTSGGSIETLVNDWQVKPTGPAPVVVVMTVTPEGKAPMTSR